MQIFRVNVTNTGTMDGDDAVLVYVTPPQILRDGQTPPIKQLFGFERIHLAVNETQQVFFPFSIESLFTIARDGSKWLHPGQYRILIDREQMFTIELHGCSTLSINKLKNDCSKVILSYSMVEELFRRCSMLKSLVQYE